MQCISPRTRGLAPKKREHGYSKVEAERGKCRAFFAAAESRAEYRKKLTPQEVTLRNTRDEEEMFNDYGIKHSIDCKAENQC